MGDGLGPPGPVRRARFAFACGALALACALAVPAIRPAAAAETPERYALLVGVGRYPSLKPAFQLAGPPNDVRLMKQVLEGDPFHLNPGKITALTDWQTDAALRPTRANIEREFARLAAVAHAGDQVFILMGGHGSQQPADDDPNDFEPDGLDEIFLPSDVRAWDGRKGTVVNAIVDDEIKVWVDRIRTSGAFVWIAFDSCHSGTMLRGAPASVERQRQVPMEELIPASALRTGRADAHRGGSPPQQGSSADDLDFHTGDVVALYAAQPYELTPEMGTPARGLFTFTMAEVLVQARSPLTYRELAERIADRYRSLNRVGPTPMLEGTGSEREVLGQRTWPDRPQWTIAHDARKRVVVNAGRLTGLTPGSILEVFPPAGEAGSERATGYVRIADAGPLESVVEPVSFNGVAALPVDRLSPGSRSRLAQADFGDLTLRIGVQRQRGPGDVDTIAAGSAPARVAAAMGGLAERSRGFARAVDDPAQADWFVRLLPGGQAVLVPASGLQAAEPNREQARFDVGSVEEETFDTQLVSAVTRLARARNLLSIAGAPDPAANGPDALNLKVELLRAAANGTDMTAVEFGTDGRVLRAGDRVAFRLSNAGETDVDVTLLLVDADFRIVSLFPSAGSLNNRLDRGKRYTTRFFSVSSPFGSEQVVAIAVPAASPTVSFASLEQDPLTASRGGARALSGASPLGRLLDRAINGDGATRSLTVPELATYRMTLLSWRTEPAAAGGTTKP